MTWFVTPEVPRRRIREVQSADYVKYREERLGVPGFFGTVRDLFSETGLFEADLSFLHFGREPTGLQSLFGLFDGLLRTTDIDVFGLLDAPVSDQQNGIISAITVTLDGVTSA